MQDNLSPNSLQVEIIFEDDDIVAINKPAGLLTIQDGYQISLPNVRSILGTYIPKVWTIHRLDKETSGLLIFAKNPVTHRSLSMQFEKRSIKKVYRGIVLDIPEWQKKIIDLPLRVNGDRRHRTIIDFKFGKPAQTYVEVINTQSAATLLSIQPRTGYTHQIRAHLSYIGNPIVGDDLYRSQNEFRVSVGEHYLATRLMLHAYSIEFAHPKENKLMQLIAPCPSDFHL
jgi:RluA family pseudouridine synthase